ncbi:hypothetical protein SAMN05216236_13940 [Sedimentitalea nanhaiensis]|uniref:Uncharacterized protein n=1 Tax=Sedimentitalea nanhaiensis TaxID=999627 RepID=A0A1I7E0A9_9RHOB|nr:hypothetical protein SAMN05216236_13940 [Sedimentitalea nanhaiensis]
MNRQNATIDWEDIMTTTECSAGIAARMSERTVAALAEALENQRRHSHQLNQLAKVCEEMSARPTPTPQPCPRHSSPGQPQPKIRLFPLIVAFVVGAASAGFIASW